MATAAEMQASSISRRGIFQVPLGKSILAWHQCVSEGHRQLLTANMPTNHDRPASGRMMYDSGTI